MSAVVRHEGDAPVEGWAGVEALGWRTLISADRTDTDSITLGVAELAPSDAEPRWHCHAQAEVYYVLQGEGVVRIDGRDHAISAGDAVFIPGNAEHGARNTGDSLLRILYVFATDSFGDVEYVFSE